MTKISSIHIGGLVAFSKVPDEELKEMNEIADMLYDGSDEYIVGEDGRIINEEQEGCEVALDYEAKDEECIFWKGFLSPMPFDNRKER